MAATDEATDTGSPQGRFRVMTANLLSPHHADWDRRRLVLLAGLTRLRPDVVALQETVCARFVEERLADRDWHVVLAGDFDDTPDSASVRFWTGRQSLAGTSVAYRDAWESVHPGAPGHTFSPTNPLVRAGEMSLEPGRRIDYIMVRCGVHGPTLDVVDCFLAFDEPVDGVWGTDHFGLVADLQMPANPPGSWSANDRVQG